MNVWSLNFSTQHVLKSDLYSICNFSIWQEVVILVLLSLTGPILAQTLISHLDELSALKHHCLRVRQTVSETTTGVKGTDGECRGSAMKEKAMLLCSTVLSKSHLLHVILCLTCFCCSQGSPVFYSDTECKKDPLDFSFKVLKSNFTHWWPQSSKYETFEFWRQHYLEIL